MNRLGLVPVLLALGGCATAPAPLRGEFTQIAPNQSAQRADGSAVRWGGSIIATEPGATHTCVEILGRELNESARPRYAPDQSAGRFLACRDGFYDPAIFATDREVTVTGRLNGFVTRRIGEYDYRYPRVDADVIYLWPERRQRPVYHYDPFWPAHRSFWWTGLHYRHPFPLEKTVQPPMKAKD